VAAAVSLPNPQTRQGCQHTIKKIDCARHPVRFEAAVSQPDDGAVRDGQSLSTRGDHRTHRTPGYDVLVPNSARASCTNPLTDWSKAFSVLR
jgi:hypothetical protein